MNESPLPGQVLRDSPLAGYNHTEAEVADLDTANIITSEVHGKPGRHKPVLDIDLPVKLIPSTTEGHFHLMIDKEMDWEDYQRLLWVLADIGIVEEGYASASDERGYTAVRLPWISKDDDREMDEPDECRCPGCLVAQRHREERERARTECECADCVPSPTHRLRGQRADMVIMDEARSFDLTDQQREYLSVLAEATERTNEQVWENNSRPPYPRQPVVNAPATGIQFHWETPGERRTIQWGRPW